ncbi:uncharacterized protein LOC142339797 isoform X2 [Convolutriloba macropyga]|uniref:uncharacterized protein LOC142339797 isoform X2 n=1 Tax=Convolutriloba macropyga TaxID=536237 RepID=UPI003F51EDB9
MTHGAALSYNNHHVGAQNAPSNVGYNPTHVNNNNRGGGGGGHRYGSDTAVPIKEGDFYSKFLVVAKKGEGTFSEVLECKSKASILATNDNGTTSPDPNAGSVAVKRLKTKYPHIHAANKNREIQAMRRLSNHPNVLKMKEILFEPKTGTLYIILDLMDMNLFEYIRTRKQYIAENRIRFYMLQLIDALRYIHKSGIFHRDVKPENILVKNDTIRLADFGSCRSREARQPFTEYISTRWYRAPECLLTDGYYDYKMDVWAVGCVFFELNRLAPLFPGHNEIDQIDKIHRLMGTPPPELLAKFKRSRTMSFNFPQRARDQDLLDKLLENVPQEGVDLFTRLLTYDPEARITMEDALHHLYITKLIDKLKKRREEKMTSVAPAAENTGRGSPNRMRNLERAIIRQSPNKATDSSKVVPNQQHAGKTTVSPDNKQQATVIVKKPSPGLEKQIHRTNAELRNTKKIVQNIRAKAENDANNLESPTFNNNSNNKKTKDTETKKKYISKSLDNIANLAQAGAIKSSENPEFNPFYTKSPSNNKSRGQKITLPAAIDKAASPRNPISPHHSSGLSLLQNANSGSTSLGGSQSNLTHLQKLNNLQSTNVKLPYLSHSLGSLQERTRNCL